MLITPLITGVRNAFSVYRTLDGQGWQIMLLRRPLKTVETCIMMYPAIVMKYYFISITICANTFVCVSVQTRLLTVAKNIAAAFAHRSIPTTCYRRIGT